MSEAGCRLRIDRTWAWEVSATTDIRFDRASYPLREASRLVGVPHTTVQRWLRIDRAAANVGGGALIQPTVDDPSGALSFINLIEVLALGRIRAAGVSLQRARTALLYVQQELGTPHALASQRMLTDGVDLFWHFQQEQDAAVHLVNISRGGQKVFRDVIADYLEEIEWGVDSFAGRWWPSVGRREVVVDPKRGFGAPTIASTGIRTEDVYERFEAGESVMTLARDFGLEVAQVEAAIRAEAGFLGRLAA